MSPPPAAGPVVIAYDGSAQAEIALIEAAGLLRPRQAVVLVVWKEGVGLSFVDRAEHLPLARLDVRTASDVDEAIATRAQQLAEHGAALAREAGLDAEGLAVAEEVDVPVSDTIVDVADQRGAASIALGTHGHGGAIGPISRDVIRHAHCPVLVRGPAR